MVGKEFVLRTKHVHLVLGIHRESAAKVIVGAVRAVGCGPDTGRLIEGIDPPLLELPCHVAGKRERPKGLTSESLGVVAPRIQIRFGCAAGKGALRTHLLAGLIAHRAKAVKMMARILPNTMTAPITSQMRGFQ